MPTNIKGRCYCTILGFFFFFFLTDSFAHISAYIYTKSYKKGIRGGYLGLWDCWREIGTGHGDKGGLCRIW